MVKDCFKILKSPLFLASVIVSFLVYTGIFPAKNKNPFFCLCPEEKISFLEGKISSNPVKNTEKGFYSMDFSPLLAKDKSGGEYSAKGKVRIIVGEEIAESCFPGKLYSLSKENSKEKSVLCEKGVSLSLEGSFKGGFFFADEASETETKKEQEKTFLSFFSDFFVKIRSLSRLHFRRMMFFWKDAGGLFLALVSGIREYTDLDLQDAFRNAGLSHILALSGMHLSLFSGISSRISKRCFSEKTGFFLDFAVISVFVWFAGFSPSLLRAFLCRILLMSCSLANLKNVSLMNILSLSFLIQASFFTQDLFSAAFMLSYGALAGILLFSDFFVLIFSRMFPSGFSGSLASSAGAQIITAPLSLKIFGFFSPAGIIATVFVSPLVSFFIYSGLLVFILSLAFPFLSSAGAIFMNFVYNLTGKAVFIFSLFPPLRI